VSEAGKWLDKRIAELEKELEMLKALKQLISAPPQPEAPSQDLEKLAWRQYRDGRGEWVFADEAPAELVNRIESSKEGLKIGNYVYEVSTGGGGKKFLRRRPVKAPATG